MYSLVDQTQSTWVILKIRKAATRGSNARVVVRVLLHCQQDSCINPICWNTVIAYQDFPSILTYLLTATCETRPDHIPKWILGIKQV